MKTILPRSLIPSTTLLICLAFRGLNICVAFSYHSILSKSRCSNINDVPKSNLQSECDEQSRRGFLSKTLTAGAASIFAGVLVGSPRKSLADDEHLTTTTPSRQLDNKPTAALEYLLPATRVRLYVGHMANIAETLSSSDESDSDKASLIDELSDGLLNPQQFMTQAENSASKQYLKVKTWDAWEKVQEEQYSGFGAPPLDPAMELNKAFEKWGQRRQWKILRRRQITLENSNSMRAAFNAYTNNLVFGESNVFTGSREERKQRIRNDDLPDVTSVITSDLDLRDLYRNQVLTAMDDAKAELEYQLRVSDDLQLRVRDDLSSGSSLDFAELFSLLKDAKKSCDNWFGFVPEKDARAALTVVLEQG